MPESSLRVGFAGLGRVADVHYAALLSCAGAGHLAAVCDLRSEAVQKRSAEWGVPGFLSLESMLQQVELDAVAVLLPHDMHRLAMQELMKRRIPVLLEKPLAATVEDAKSIVAQAVKANVTVLVGHNGLFHPAFERVAAMVRGGWLGRPLMASAKSVQWLDFRPWDFRKSREKTGGGAWVDCGGHLIYRLNEILGRPEKVTGLTSHLARPEMEGEDSAMAILRYPGGVLAQVMVSYGFKLPRYQSDWPEGCEQSLVISGDQGVVEYHDRPRLFEPPRVSVWEPVVG